MTEAQGLLLAMMHPADADEYNDWADTEHLPERERVPGIRTAMRYENIKSIPRFLNLYDLDDLSVLQSPSYIAISGDNSSPWSKRISSGATHRWRFTGLCIASWTNRENTDTTNSVGELLLVRWRGVTTRSDEVLSATFQEGLRGQAGIARTRIFVSDNTDGSVDYAGIAESTTSFDPPLSDPDIYSTTLHSCDFTGLFAPMKSTPAR
ncbi:hypothetical protein EEB12_29100 [Rhodococcus sp. WS1]|nr:hypothetical protein EEB12_29100 [Rhodococcus sp. WS1]